MPHPHDECYNYNVQDAYDVKYLLLGVWGRDKDGEFRAPDRDEQLDGILRVLDIVHKETKREAEKLTPESPVGVLANTYRVIVEYHTPVPGLFVSEDVVRLFAEVKGLSFDEFCIKLEISRSWTYRGTFVPFHGYCGELGGCEVAREGEGGKICWAHKGFTGHEMFPPYDLDQLREYVGKPWSDLFNAHGWPDEHDLEDEEGDEI